MHNYANATLEGFATHEPELKTTRTGKSVCTFSLAVNHHSGENSEPKVSFIDVETWDKVAEICSKGVEKGKRIMVIGSLRQDRWENSDGDTRSRVKVIGNEIRFLESKPVAKVS